MLRAVTLDYWNTLFVDTHAAARERRRADRLRAELDALGIHPDPLAVDAALRDTYRYFEAIWRREQRTPTCPELVDHLLATLRAQPPRAVVARISATFERLILELPPDPVPDMQHVILELAERYRLAVICDTAYSPGSALRTLLDRAGVLHAFTYLYFSNEGERSKPHPLVFRTALEHLDVHPAEAAHVGDMQRTDIAGARAAGMWSVHFLGVDDRDASVSTADAKVHRLRDLPAALAALEQREGRGRR